MTRGVTWLLTTIATASIVSSVISGAFLEAGGSNCDRTFAEQIEGGSEWLRNETLAWREDIRPEVAERPVA
ncbi:MAG TPA: hypothetical protein VIY86_05680, partial [Pirellulaceae bacterium]